MLGPAWYCSAQRCSAGEGGMGQGLHCRALSVAGSGLELMTRVGGKVALWLVCPSSLFML